MMASSSFPPLPMSLFLALVHQSPTSCDNKDKSLPTVGTGFHQSPPLPLFLSIETSKSCKIKIEILSQTKFSFLVSLRFQFQSVSKIHKKLFLSTNEEFVSSVRSSCGYHGLLNSRSKATFSNFSDSKVKVKVKVKVKGPNMCYIFEKHWIQGYRTWHSRVSKYTNTRLHK